MKRLSKTLALGCAAAILMPWSQFADFINGETEGYYLNTQGIRSGFGIIRLGASGRGEMTSYDATQGMILNRYPFSYTSDALTIALEFDKGKRSILTRKWLGLVEGYSCSEGNCGGIGHVSWLGTGEEDLPASYRRALSIIHF